MLTAAVEAGTVNFIQAVAQSIAQAGDISSVLLHIFLCIFKRCGKSDDAGKVFGTGTLAALLTAAANKTCKLKIALGE